MNRTIPLFPALALLAAASALPACSVSPVYQVRVENNSSATVIALISADVSFAEDDILARARIRPHQQALLGPVTGEPLQRVELLISRPEDLQTMPEKMRLSRGTWLAEVSDAPISTWNRYSVQLRKSDEPFATEPAEESTPKPAGDPAGSPTSYQGR